MKFSYPPFVRIILTAKSTKRSSRSNILLSFDIHYSLFDIRYWTPCKKYQKQLSAYGALALMAQQREVVHVIYCQSLSA